RSEIESLEPAPHHDPADPEEPRRLADVPAGRAQALLHELALELIETRKPLGERSRAVDGGRGRAGPQVTGIDAWPVGDDRGALDLVGELSHVARPRIAVEHRQRRGRETAQLTPEAPRCAREEQLGEQPDVAAP